MDFKITGTITAIDEKSGKTKDGKQWRKVMFVVTNNDGFDGRENEYALSKFGDEHVDNFVKFNKVGDLVEVQFSISSRAYNGKYYTDLRAFRVDHVKAEKPKELAPKAKPSAEVLNDDLPF